LVLVFGGWKGMKIFVTTNSFKNKEILGCIDYLFFKLALAISVFQRIHVFHP
jgi:hypothetical protein